MTEYNLTTAISYVNGPPHLGHTLEFLIADVISRYHKINGHKVHFLTGTDEHGQKIQDTAEKEGLQPIELCDKNSKLFIELNHSMGIEYDNFIRTTNPNHKRVVYEFYERCKDDIYLGSYEGWYDTREERFVSLSDAKLTDFKDPTTGKDYLYTSEPSYFFKLSKYKSRVLDYLKDREDFIYPQTKVLDIINRLETTELEDLSISRTSVKWGIQHLDNPDHVFYVWFDALINYISGGPWPCNVHIIGKDILWFHTVIWLSMLFSAGYDVPKHIYVHDFVNDHEGKKMSKSVGNVIDPNYLIDKYPLAAIRYYLISNLNYGSDMNFSESELIRSHDNELLEIYGNCVNRVFGLVHKYWNSKINYYTLSENRTEPFDLNKVRTELENAMNEFKLQEYVNTVMNLVKNLNKYINDTHIWNINIDDNNNRDELLAVFIEALYILTHFLYPIILNVCNKVFEFLGTDMVKVSELNWNNIEPGTIIPKKTILFEIIDTAAANERKNKNKRK